MAKNKKQQKNKKQINNKLRDGLSKCWFCEHKVIPDYKDIDVLQGFLSPRGKILSRQVTATCAKHQRLLSSEVKMSREMALIR